MSIVFFGTEKTLPFGYEDIKDLFVDYEENLIDVSTDIECMRNAATFTSMHNESTLVAFRRLENIIPFMKLQHDLLVMSNCELDGAPLAAGMIIRNKGKIVIVQPDKSYEEVCAVLSEVMLS